MMSTSSIAIDNNTLKILGELTFDTVVQLRNQGEQQIKKIDNVQIDFTEVTKCDSSALVLMLAWMRAAKSSGNKLRFISIPKELLAVAKLYGINEFL